VTACHAHRVRALLLEHRRIADDGRARDAVASNFHGGLIRLQAAARRRVDPNVALKSPAAVRALRARGGRLAETGGVRAVRAHPGVALRQHDVLEVDGAGLVVHVG